MLKADDLPPPLPPQGTTLPTGGVVVVRRVMNRCAGTSEELSSADDLDR